MTGWHSLITRGQLQPGETILIIGASGAAAWWYLSRPEPVSVRVQAVETGRAGVQFIDLKAQQARIRADNNMDQTWAWLGLGLGVGVTDDVELGGPRRRCCCRSGSMT